MSFTDDDLKRLREFADKLESGEDFAMPTPAAVRALVARLEAAEHAILAMIELDDFIALGSTSDLEGHNRMVDKTRTAMETWRKAAGFYVC